VHPNEYIRGITLRFITKVAEKELIEPLVKPIIQNLKDRHSYVRRNAVLAVWHIYQHFPELISDAPDLVEEFLEGVK
jgi:coatomer subunit beta